MTHDIFGTCEQGHDHSEDVIRIKGGGILDGAEASIYALFASITGFVREPETFPVFHDWLKNNSEPNSSLLKIDVPMLNGLILALGNGVMAYLADIIDTAPPSDAHEMRMLLYDTLGDIQEQS